MVCLFVADLGMFQSITDRIAANAEHRYQGMTVADFDGDGANEIFIAVAGSANRVLKWNHGQLVNATPPILGDGPTFAKAAMAADIDGDGREELYVINASPYGGEKPIPDRLFSVQANGSWAEWFSTITDPKLRNIVTGTAVAALDRRGNGRYTFVVLNDRRPMRWYELGPTGKLLDLAHSLHLDLSGVAAWVGPIVSTSADLMIVNPLGPNRLLVNQGNGHFDEATHYKLNGDAHPGSRVLGFDAENDGRFHLVVTHADEPHQLMIRQIDGNYKNEASWGMALPSRCAGVLAADFDNDGYEELIFINENEANRGFRRSEVGQPTWRKFDLGDLTQPKRTLSGAAIADIDNDGTLELLLAHGPNQALTLHKSTTAHPNWLRVQPLTRFGAPARGATVELIAGKRKQIRVIHGGGSPIATEPIAHFGLGNITTVNRITITWPDGAKKVMSNPPTRQTHQVVKSQ